MEQLARILVIFGLVLLVAGGLVWVLARFGITLGQLPGDIRIQSGNMTCLFPVVTMILVSVLLTVILNLVARLFK